MVTEPQVAQHDGVSTRGGVHTEPEQGEPCQKEDLLLLSTSSTARERPESQGGKLPIGFIHFYMKS